MKLTKTPYTCVLVFSLLGAGCASNTYTSADLHSVSPSSNIFFSVTDGVGVIQGIAETEGERLRLTRSALELEGVTKVRNHVSVSR